MLLKIHVEGDTEKRFVDRVLISYLTSLGFIVKVQTNQTDATHFGGLSTYAQFRKNTIRLRGHAPCLITTMIDLYQLPSDFPGKDEAESRKNAEEKVLFLEQKLKEDLDELSPDFIPYIQLHEFEALLFSSVDTINRNLQNATPSTLSKLKTVLHKFGEPEKIDTNKGPSVHLKEIYGTQYQKIYHGIPIAENIGLEVIREKCPHFDSWLKKLEEYACSHR
ncbi:MAG: DUF4276 family protein [Methanocorpusculum sp.]|uniref:DUF4276 family protein n=1 Tax=Methanocorpusculum sp. TaxID=2058474 RepID=UPI0027207895|nr:DUF4276 family protein [Methanocorpusculum sp.]MDO9522325.1 DUF4276 family protein [Methanocorpusculum sp.]